MPPKPLLQIDRDSAEDFLREIDLNRAPLSDGEWLFRGHKDVSWHLTPSIFRDDAETVLRITSAIGRPSNFPSYEWAADRNGYHVLREATMLYRFALALDDGGLRLPGPGTPTVHHLERLIDNVKQSLREYEGQELENLRPPVQWRPTNENWPTPEAIQLLALARHVGIPSRLLDWVLSPMTAAYFACSDAVRENLGAGHRVCVWALSTKIFHPFTINGHRVQLVWPVRVLREGNRNMAAQRGRFTTTYIGEFEWPYRAPDKNLDTLIESQFPQMSGQVQTYLHHCLCKVTLDAGHADEVLWRLRRLGISKITMFPDYNSVVDEFKEEYGRQAEAPPAAVDEPVDEGAGPAGAAGVDMPVNEPEA